MRQDVAAFAANSAPECLMQSRETGAPSDKRWQSDDWKMKLAEFVLSIFFGLQDMGVHVWQANALWLSEPDYARCSHKQ